MSSPVAEKNLYQEAEQYIPAGYDPELYKVRHSAAHIMAQAVKERFEPEGAVRVAIGPPIEDGFYYDFELPRQPGQEDLEWIEKRMGEIIRGRHPFEVQEVSAEEARERFADEPYKLELIEGLAAGQVDEYGNPLPEDVKPRITLYQQDSFVDLCRGPHVQHTGKLKASAIKLMNIAGAYWRGDENNPQLTRIYGTAWRKKSELDDYLERLEEAKARDHRKLGKELDIFVFDEEVGPGLPLWLPNGTILIEELEALAKEMERRAGYQHVRTPHLSKEDLFYRSGHLPYYQESMYPPMEMEGVNYFVKPMNCPFHHKIYASRPRSYRDLPLRLAEYGTCYRYEKSGELFGLMRVRSMQMNDAHIYCTEEQFESEFMGVIQLYIEYFRLFAIDRYVMRLSTHDKAGLGKKYVDNEALWLKTEAMVRDAMLANDVPFVEVPDEAAFYGPKIDVQIWSAIGREFTLATNQVDFAQPPRFDLVYTDSDNAQKTPLCLHRAPLSTHERMIGFLIEHFAGAFPLWLAPQQVALIPIADRHVPYAEKVAQALQAQAIRVAVDDSNNRMNAKIRDAQMQKVPYMLVVGDREAEEDMVAVRLRSGENLGAMSVEDFLQMAEGLIKDRSLDLQ